MNTNKQATGSNSKRLLAALAVLAVAFVMLAAVPAVATDSDAADPVTGDVYVLGAGYSTTANEAKEAISGLIGSDKDDVVDGTMYVAFVTTKDNQKVSIDIEVDGKGHTESVTCSKAGKNVMYWQFTDGQINKYFDDGKEKTYDSGDDGFIASPSEGKEYTFAVNTGYKYSKQIDLTIGSSNNSVATIFVDAGKETERADGTYDKPYGTLFAALSSNGAQGTATQAAYVEVLANEIGAGFTVGYEGSDTTGSTGRYDSNQYVIIELNGNTYTTKEPSVGSSSATQNQALRLAKSGDYLEIRNGTLNVSESNLKKTLQKDGTKTVWPIVTLINSYGNLTLTDMKVDGTNLVEAGSWNVSGNAAEITESNIVVNAPNGTVLINGSTSITKKTGTVNPSFALMAYWYEASYPEGPKVTLDTTGEIQTVGMICETKTESEWNGEPNITIEDAVLKQSIHIYTTTDVPENYNKAQITIAGNVEADVVFHTEGLQMGVTAGSVYSGTVSHIGSEVTTSVTLKNVRAGEGGYVLTAGSIDFYGATAEQTGSTITIVSGTARIDSEYIVPAGTKIVVSSGAALEVNGVVTISDKASITAESGSTITIAGGKTVSGEGTFTIEAGVDASGTDNISSDVLDIDSSSMATAYLGGEVTGSEFKANQRVEVTQDTTVSGDMSVAGVLHVPAGVTMTIAAGGSLTLSNIYTSTIEGTLVIASSDDKGDASLIIKDSAVLDVQGALRVAGNLVIGSTQALKVNGTAAVSIESTGSIAGKVEIDSDAFLSVEGAVVASYSGGDVTTEFTVSGTLTFNSSVISQAFAVVLVDSGSLDITKVVLANDQTIEVSDAGTVMYDKNNKDELADQGSFADTGNTLVIDPTAEADADGINYGAAVSGVKVTSSVTEKKLTASDVAVGGDYYTDDSKFKKDQYAHVSTMSVSGTVSVASTIVYDDDYSGAEVTDDTYSVEYTLDGKTAAKVSDALTFGVKVYAVFKGKVSVEASVTMSYMAGDSTASPAVPEKKSTLTIGAGAEVSVKDVIDASASKAKTTPAKLFVSELASGAGYITLSDSGCIVTAQVISNSTSTDANVNGISAAYYKINVGTSSEPVNVYYYTTVDAALAKLVDGTVTSVSLYGEQTLTASVEVPTQAALELQSGSTLNVGSSDEGTDIVLAFAAGSAFKNGTSATGFSVKVNGTVYAANKTNVGSGVQDAIESAVVSYQMNGDKVVNSGWAKWTNLTTALAEAESGQEIVLNGNVVLSVNTTVPAGVFLNQNGHTVVVGNSVVFTIDGTVDLTAASVTTGTGISVLAVAEKFIGSTASKNRAAGTIVLNGYIAYDSADQIVNATYDSGITGGLEPYEVGSTAFLVGGAYYAVDYVNYISTVANAAAVIATVDNQTVDLRSNGTLSFFDVAFKGKAADDTATVNVHCSVSATGIVLENATVVFDASLVVSVEFIDVNGSVILAGYTGGAAPTATSTEDTRLTVSSLAYSDDVSAVLGVSGTIADYRTYTADGETSVIASSDDTNYSRSAVVSTGAFFTGTVYILGSASITTDKLTVDGTLSVVKADGTSSTGNAGVTVLGGPTLDKSGANNVYTVVSINGTLGIKDSATVGSTKTTVSVTGNLYVTKGSFTATTVDVSGTLVIKEGTDSSIGTLTVSGSVDVTATSTSTLQYTGKLTISSALYIGTTEETVGVDAAVTGNVALGSNAYVVVAAGSTVPLAWTSDDSNLADPDSLIYAKTVYTVDDAEYITVYVPAGKELKISTFKASKDNAEFSNDVNVKTSGWFYTDSEGRSQKVGDQSYVGAIDSVYAVFNTSIFAIEITADGGVSYITVDGVLMTYKDGKFFITGLKAGEHTITASAVSGYDISKIALYAGDGTAVGSMTVSLSKTDDDAPASGGNTAEYYTSYYQLIGSETAAPSGGSSSGSDFSGIIDAIDKNTDAVKNQENGGSDSSLTDILLIVLVVLIVIMAALVAMRMMRG